METRLQQVARQLDFCPIFLEADHRAITRIADRSRYQRAVACFNRREGDLHRELRPILSAPLQWRSSAERLGLLARVSTNGAFIEDVRSRLRDKDIYGVINQFRAGVPEQVLGLGVDDDDASSLVDGDGRVLRDLLHSAEVRRFSAPLGDIPNRERRDGSAVCLRRREHDLGSELRTILTPCQQLRRSASRSDRCTVLLGVSLLREGFAE